MALYVYKGDGITFDDANPEFELDLVVGDEFVMEKLGAGPKYIVYHSTARDIPFTLTGKEARALLKVSEKALNVEPNPNNPPYLMYDPKFEIVPKFYDYYNKLLFNGGCPIVKFTKTRREDVLGLAELNWHRGKPIYTLYINEKSMADIKLFTNTVVHEMIHLYLFAKGVKQNDKSIVLDNHGPNFQREMNRINGQGFNIGIEASGEHFQGEASETNYAVVVERASSIQCYFSRTSMLDRFEAFCDEFVLQYPSTAGIKISLLETTDLRVAQYTAFPKTGNVKAAAMKKWYASPQPPFTGRILRTMTTEVVDNLIPDYNDAPDVYCLPFNQFAQRMARYRASESYMRAKWAKFPLRTLNKRTAEELTSISGRVRRGAIAGPDLHNRLSDIVASYDGRCEQSEYRAIIAKILEKSDPTHALVPEYSTLRLR